MGTTRTRTHTVKILTLTLLLMLSLSLQAQQPRPTATLAFTYTFQSTEGMNASAVAYIPERDLYVTCIAGNADYPIEVFNRQGKTIGSVPAGKDLRGIWYNPSTGCIEANLAGEEGWYSTSLDADGVPTTEWTLIRKGQFQPEFQSVLAYVAPKKQLVTITNGFFSYWGRKNGKQKVRYQHGTPGDTNWYFNSHCAGYTGNPKFPIAVLELNAGEILFWDLKGTYLGATKIPNVPEMDGFRFACANGHAFLFDETSRTWSAYRIFE